MKQKSLYARVTDDGYLLGTTDDFVNGERERFWADYFEEGLRHLGIATVKVIVPEDMVEGLLDHGTSAQTYSDGYEAWQDILQKGKVSNRIVSRRTRS